MAEAAQKINRIATIKGIIFLLAFLFLVTAIGSWSILHVLKISQINATGFFISRLFYWICAGLIWWYAVKIEKQPLLIWQEKKYNFLFYLVSVIGLLFVLCIGMFIIQAILLSSGLITKSTRLSEITNILRTNMPLFLFTCLTAGIMEELIFRGYLQPRLEIIFKSPLLAIVVSSLLFGLMHFKYGTIINVAGPIFIGLIFACYYWKYRNIRVLILFHFLWDFGVLFLSLKHN
ncbi:MAG: type II CAAX endopeptidase family protein [Bacteroidota bacterium]